MTKSQAQTKLQEILRPLNEGHHVAVEQATFKEFYDKWEQDMLPTYKDSTGHFYRSIVGGRILQRFATWPLSEIKPADVQQFTNLFAGQSISSLKHLRAGLNSIFSVAVRWQYLRENPAQGLRLPQGKPVQRATVLSPAQLSELIAALASPYKEMVWLGAQTAMRPSELFGLTWADVDFDAAEVHVRQRVYRYRIGPPKTPRATRSIPLPVPLLAALRAMKGELDQPVFHGERGSYLRPDKVFRDHIRPVAKALNFPNFTLESLRRSGESAMHHNGTPLKVQSAMMGHSNPNITLMYAETNDQAKREAATKLGELINPSFPETTESEPLDWSI
jgi:integrase